MKQKKWFIKEEPDEEKDETEDNKGTKMQSLRGGNYKNERENAERKEKEDEQVGMLLSRLSHSLTASSTRRSEQEMRISSSELPQRSHLLYWRPSALSLMFWWYWK